MKYRIRHPYVDAVQWNKPGDLAAVYYSVAGEGRYCIDGQRLFPGYWVVTNHNWLITIMSPEDFAAQYEPDTRVPQTEEGDKP